MSNGANVDISECVYYISTCQCKYFTFTMLGAGLVFLNLFSQSSFVFTLLEVTKSKESFEEKTLQFREFFFCFLVLNKNCPFLNEFHFIYIFFIKISRDGDLWGVSTLMLTIRDAKLNYILYQFRFW